MNIDRVPAIQSVYPMNIRDKPKIKATWYAKKKFERIRWAKIKQPKEPKIPKNIERINIENSVSTDVNCTKTAITTETPASSESGYIPKKDRGWINHFIVPNSMIEFAKVWYKNVSTPTSFSFEGYLRSKLREINRQNKLFWILFILKSF